MNDTHRTEQNCPAIVHLCLTHTVYIVYAGIHIHALLSLFTSFLVVVNENVSLVISRQLLTDFCTHLPNLPDSTAKAIYHFTLEKIQPRVISFEEQVGAMFAVILILILSVPSSNFPAPV